MSRIITSYVISVNKYGKFCDITFLPNITKNKPLTPLNRCYSPNYALLTFKLMTFIRAICVCFYSVEALFIITIMRILKGGQSLI